MKSVVVLGLSRLSISKKVGKTRFIVTSMGSNAYFPTPNPPLNTITANVNALEAASIAALGGGVDDTANMRAKETALDLSLKSLAAYVEGIANATPLNAEAIILSAGMEVKAKGRTVVHEFDVKVTGNPGEVKLFRKGIKRGSLEFQMSTDITKEENWQRVYTGTRGRIIKSGLTSGTRYYFRSATIDKDGQSPWSRVLNTIAL